MEEPLSPEMPGFEPGAGPLRFDSWRVITNFSEAGDISQRFSKWPDDFLSSDCLESMYCMNLESVLPGYSVKHSDRIHPGFPFLDEEEGQRITGVWERYRSKLHPLFRDLLLTIRELHGKAVKEVTRDTRWSKDGGKQSSLQPAKEAKAGTGTKEILDKEIVDSGLVALILQTQVILGFREMEKACGVWEGRTPGQKLGTILAAKPSCSNAFTRVEAVQVRRGALVFVPWGGLFAEYGKILHLMDNQFTRKVIGSYDENLEVVPDGHVLKTMTGAGLLRSSRQAFMDSHWNLGLPVIDAAAVLDVTGLVDNAVAQICECVSDVLGDLKGLIATGRYSYLEGHGDYFEMAYSVLVGLLLNWAAEDGLITRPPTIGVRGDRVFLKRSIGQRIKGFYPVLTGIGVLEQPELLWEKINSHSTRR
jgi:hypothetical protein